jgi:biotin carboxyl carrier protein
MIHDVESYIITIKRKGTAVQATAVVASAPAVASVVVPAESQAVEVKSAEVRAATKAVVSPLPGVVVEVKVAAGDVVKAGQTVAVLEAMKMENDILAECDGVVASVDVKDGDSVLEGAVLLTIN